MQNYAKPIKDRNDIFNLLTKVGNWQKDLMAPKHWPFPDQKCKSSTDATATIGKCQKTMHPNISAFMAFQKKIESQMANLMSLLSLLKTSGSSSNKKTAAKPRDTKYSFGPYQWGLNKYFQIKEHFKQFVQGKLGIMCSPFDVNGTLWY